MAIDYAKLFRTLAPYAEQILSAYDQRDRIGDITTATLSRHTTYGALDSIETVESSLQSLRDSLTAIISTAASQVEAVLSDRDMVLQHLAIPASATFNEIWSAFLADYVANAGVNRCSYLNLRLTDPRGGLADVSVGIYDTQGISSNVFYLAAIDPDRTAGFQAVVVPFLSGVDAPALSIEANPNYAGVVPTFLNDGEVLKIAVALDSISGGAARNGEQFSFFGTPRSIGSTAGNTPLQQLTTPYADINQQAGLDPNTVGLFSAWTDGTPDGWTVVAGTPTGSDPDDETFEDDTDDADFYQVVEATAFGGCNSIFIKDEISTAVQLTYPIPLEANFTRGRYYLLSWWEKSTELTATTLNLVGSGVSGEDLSLVSLNLGPGASTQTMRGKIAYDTLPTAAKWRFNSKLYIANPNFVSDNILLQILRSTSTTLDTSTITGISITPVSYYSGLGLVILPGPDAAVLGDVAEVSVVNTLLEGEWEDEAEATFTSYHGRMQRALQLAIGRPVPGRLVYNEVESTPDTYLDENLTTVP